MKQLRANLEKLDALLHLYAELMEGHAEADEKTRKLKASFVKKDILKLIVDTNELVKALESKQNV